MSDHNLPDAVIDLDAYQAARNATSAASEACSRASSRWDQCLMAMLRAEGGRGAARAMRRLRRARADAVAASDHFDKLWEASFVSAPGIPAATTPRS